MLPTLLQRFFKNNFNYYCGKIFCVIFVFFAVILMQFTVTVGNSVSN